MSPHQPKLFEPPANPEPWESAAAADRLVAQIVVNRPVETVYHYLVPDPLRELIAPGQRVRVPFGRGNQLIAGFCVGLGGDDVPGKRLKALAEVLDRDAIATPEMLELTGWIAEHYLCGWGQALDAIIPAGVKRQAGTRLITYFKASDNAVAELENRQFPEKQRRVLESLIEAGRPLTIHELTDAAECGTAPVKALEKKGLLKPLRRRVPTSLPDEPAAVAPVPPIHLNNAQQQVLDVVLDLLRTQRHETALLHGVTGSGKTEIYIRAIEEVVSYGRQAIVLVPEISLTPQTIRRFRRRFQSVSVLHSHLSDGERHWHWQSISRGEVQVVVGARSAIFAPTPNLGLIVIDEEHETTFKQQTTPRYHAREVARERARRLQIPLLLGSATPTLESVQRVRDKHNILLSLPQRVADRPLPPVVVVDTRNDPQLARGHAIGRALQSNIRLALADAGQVILFLNLRGYSTVIWCRSCSAGLKCPHCDLTLTWHRERGRAMCHSCEYEEVPPERCPSCGNPGLRYFGTGTQRLEQEVRTKFPDARIVRMDSDSMRRPGSHDTALEAFRNGEVDILLGTQMIAKGLDFPNVTLVGVVDADTLLHQPDLRAAERTFQLIAQVAGRTGRGDRPGRVLVQTMCPDEPVILKAAGHDFIGFAKSELAHRKSVEAPPFAWWARVILRSENESVAQSETRRIATLIRDRISETKSPLKLKGPAPAPLVKLKGYYRFHFILTTSEPGSIQPFWRSVQGDLDLAGDVELTVDVDPLDLR